MLSCLYLRTDQGSWKTAGLHQAWILHDGHSARDEEKKTLCNSYNKTNEMR